MNCKYWYGIINSYFFASPQPHNKMSVIFLFLVGEHNCFTHFLSTNSLTKIGIHTLYMLDCYLANLTS